MTISKYILTRYHRLLASALDGHCQKLAVKHLERAAALGYDWAEVELGSRLIEGRGLEKDVRRALRLFCSAAKMDGKYTVYAEANIGACFLKGVGVREDVAEAVRWFEKASDKGHAISQYNLGLAFYDGWAGKIDKEKGRELIKSAADAGLPEAVEALKRMLDQ